MEDAPERPIITLANAADDRVEARFPDQRSGTGVSVDFASLRFPDGAASVRGLPLVRACGREGARDGLTLIDPTAGLGYDAYLLAMAGFRVTAIERSPEVFRLLEDGLRRHPCERLVVRQGDATTMLESLAAPRVDVIYLDPMYPLRKRVTALPSKDMQILRALVGDDLDFDALFAVARRCANRVVVKRPAHAQPMAPTHAQIASKLARFDIYIQ